MRMKTYFHISLEISVQCTTVQQRAFCRAAYPTAKQRQVSHYLGHLSVSKIEREEIMNSEMSNKMRLQQKAFQCMSGVVKPTFSLKSNLAVTQSMHNSQILIYMILRICLCI